jgi:predicted GIY-YIG superfamily endonuclease
MEKSDYVYLLASGRNGTLDVGVTNDLIRPSASMRHISFQASKYDVTS